MVALWLCMNTQHVTETCMGIGPSEKKWMDIVKIDLVINGNSCFVVQLWWETLSRVI